MESPYPGLQDFLNVRSLRDCHMDNCTDIDLQNNQTRRIYNKSMEEKYMNVFGMEIDTADIKSPYLFYRKLRPECFSDSHTEKLWEKICFASI